MRALTNKEKIIRFAAILLGAKILRERQQAAKKQQSKRKGTKRC